MESFQKTEEQLGLSASDKDCDRDFISAAWESKHLWLNSEPHSWSLVIQKCIETFSGRGIELKSLWINLKEALQAQVNFIDLVISWGRDSLNPGPPLAHNSAQYKSVNKTLNPFCALYLWPFDGALSHQAHGTRQGRPGRPGRVLTKPPVPPAGAPHNWIRHSFPVWSSSKSTGHKSRAAWNANFRDCSLLKLFELVYHRQGIKVAAKMFLIFEAALALLAGQLTLPEEKKNLEKEQEQEQEQEAELQSEFTWTLRN